MRTFVLVAALVLASVSAQAGASRGLALASHEPVVTGQPKAAETSKATDAPKYVERPPAVEPSDQPKPISRSPRRKNAPNGRGVTAD